MLSVAEPILTRGVHPTQVEHTLCQVYFTVIGPIWSWFISWFHSWVLCDMETDVFVFVAEVICVHGINILCCTRSVPPCVDKCTFFISKKVAFYPYEVLGEFKYQWGSDMLQLVYFVLRPKAPVCLLMRWLNWFDQRQNAFSPSCMYRLSLAVVVV